MASADVLSRSTSAIVRETLEGVDFEEFFKEEEAKAPRKRLRRRVIMDDDEDDIIIDDVPLSAKWDKKDEIEDDVALPPRRVQPHSGSPLRPVGASGKRKCEDALQIVNCSVKAVNGPGFDFQFVPSEDDKAVQIFGDTFPLKDWLKRHLSAKWDKDHKCWTVPLTKDLTYDSVIFRVKYCASRSWKQVPNHVHRWFIGSLRKRTFTVDLNRAFDEKEADRAAANKGLYWQKAEQAAKGKEPSYLFPWSFAHDLCYMCGYDFFFHQCPDTFPTGCPGCGRSWDD